MLIGVPREIKNNEYRVGLVPSSVRELVANGHEVIIEHNAGLGIGIDDAAFELVGARILPFASDIFLEADMIIKVKEPQSEECLMLRVGSPGTELEFAL